MILVNNNIELDLDIENNTVERIFIHQGNECHQMQNWEKPAWNVVGENVQNAIKILQSEGFERIANQDPY